MHFVTHPCHIPLLGQARPMMLCIYTSYIIAERISAIEALNEGSIVASTYVRTYVSVTLRNVNLRSRARSNVDDLIVTCTNSRGYRMCLYA